MSDLWIVAWHATDIPERFDVFEGKETALQRRDMIVMRNSTDTSLEVFVAQMDKSETAYGPQIAGQQHDFPMLGFNPNMALSDRACASALVNKLIQNNLYVTITDEEDEEIIKRSQDVKEIVDNMGHADFDGIFVESKLEDAYQGKGWFNLIWGNGDDPMELISDYSANELCDGIWAEIEDMIHPKTDASMNGGV